MRVIESDIERRGTGSDWSVGYEAGKRAYEVAAGRYRSARDYLVVTAAGTSRTHSWVDGFKSGWGVAQDD